MEKFENVIGSIRDILRKEGITGMDSINHCIFFMISRLLTEEMCKKIGINQIYAFDNIMVDEKGGELGDQDFKCRIYDMGNITKCLMFEVVNVLKFRNIKFKLESPQNLKLIYGKLKDLDTADLTTKYDLIGTIYELHLKSGTSNSLRDLGQYYTNRSVIKYMIQLCEPKMKNGLIEKIVDPTMGTGGFLTMSIKYLEEKYKHIDWVKNKDNIIGFDIDENVRNMALLNILLEIGELCIDTIIKQDTLHEDMKFRDGRFDNTILEKADVILANEPMGLKNIVHAQCCERIRNMKIRGTKAEPLFLQLFMSALNKNGRCCVIIPDGVLFNESNLHVGTRQYLIENLNLRKVVSLNDDFFLNTGVKTSILFFSNDGKTKEVEFCEIHFKDKEIEETTVLNVDCEKLKKCNYSLHINKYKYDGIKKIENVEYKKLGEICEFLPKSKRQASFGGKKGKYPFYSSSQKIMKCDEADYNDECVIIGTGGNPNMKISSKFSCSTDNIVVKGKNIGTKYLYYYLLMNTKIIENGFVGSTIKHISKTYIENIDIPIPSLETQKFIIEKLEILEKNIETSQKIIKQYQKIIKNYVECHKIGDKKNMKNIIKFVKTGKNQPTDKKKGTMYPYYGTSGINGYTNEFLFDGEFIMTPRNGTIGKIFYVSGKIFPSDHMFVIDFSDNINKKYIFYYMKSCVDLDSKKHGTTIPNITKNDIEELEIIIPTIEKQKEIVEYCDNLNNIISGIEKQIENNKILMKQIMEYHLLR